MPSTDDELILIAKAIEGHLPSLEILLYRHNNRLLSYVRSKLPERLRGLMEPQDILQDTWLTAVRLISGFRPEGADCVFRWLVAIARHQISDQLKYIRRSKRSNTRLATQGADGDSSIVRLLEELAVYHRTPSKSAMSHELMTALDSAIDRLPTDQAIALRLRHLSGLAIDEVAVQMRRSRGSVLMLCNRALKSLRWEMRSVSLYV
jgi:RNA polymerase sigma-70 factor (ECF subfamily)